MNPGPFRTCVAPFSAGLQLDVQLAFHLQDYWLCHLGHGLAWRCRASLLEALRDRVRLLDNLTSEPWPQADRRDDRGSNNIRDRTNPVRQCRHPPERLERASLVHLQSTVPRERSRQEQWLTIQGDQYGIVEKR